MNTRLKKIDVDIVGMHCASCALTIESTLKEKQGVKEAYVNLGLEKGTFIVDPEKVPLKEIVETIKDVGYDVASEKIVLSIGGMHCVSCVKTIEDAVSELDGVLHVNVNLATEKAVVEYLLSVVTQDRIKETIEDVGYSVLGTESEVGEAAEKAKIKDIRNLKMSLLFTVPLTIPILLYSYSAIFPSLNFLLGVVYYKYILFALTTPVQFLGGYRFHKGAVRSLSHLKPNMDALVSIGTFAAYFYSVFTTFVYPSDVFYETAALLLSFLLFGKYLEAVTKRITSEAVKKLLELKPENATILKDDAKDVINALKKKGIRTVMLTGDNKRNALAFAKKLGIKEFFAEVLPNEKSETLKKLQSEGRIIAMVGDGVNDAPALAQADLGIALGSGTEIAIETGDIILLRDNLRNVPISLEISERTISKVKQNMFWALFYNAALIPLAAGTFYPLIHYLLKPELAGLAMALSSVSVVTNSLFLKR